MARFETHAVPIYKAVIGGGFLLYCTLGAFGCAVTQHQTDAKQTCPPPAQYTADQDKQVKATLATIPADNPIHLFIRDYEAERDILRACNSVTR